VSSGKRFEASSIREELDQVKYYFSRIFTALDIFLLETCLLSGELTAHCVGPHKVAYCELYDHGDATFTLNVKPQEAGRHALTIKYAGEHVPGSPFTLRVSGAPDASKVLKIFENIEISCRNILLIDKTLNI
jgi:hypothetical protein